MFKDARAVRRVRGTLLRMDRAVGLDIDRFTGQHVADQLEAENIQRNAFRGDHVLGTVGGFPLAVAKRPNAVRIAYPDDPIADDHCHQRIGTDRTIVQALDRVEERIRRRPHAGAILEFVGKNIEEDFRVGARIDMPPVGAEQVLVEILVVDHVAVMCKANAVG